MSSRTPPRLLYACVTGAGAMLSVTGCYDWTLGAAPSEGGPSHVVESGVGPVDAGVDAVPTPDAGRDAGMDVTTIAEAAPQDTGRPPPDVAPPDTGRDVRVVDAPTPPPDAADCAALRATVDQTRTQARVCMAGDCASLVSDQCGCGVAVAQPSSSATAAFSAAVSALVASKCPLGCGTCPFPGASICEVGAIDGSLTELCTVQ